MHLHIYLDVREGTCRKSATDFAHVVYLEEGELFPLLAGVSVVLGTASLDSLCRWLITAPLRKNLTLYNSTPSPFSSCIFS